MFEAFLAIVSATEEPMADETPDFQKVSEFFKQKWKSPVVCPVCKETGWQTGSRIYQIPQWLVPGTVFPVVMVICTTCSYTLLFNAITVGALPPDKPKTEEGR
jgi:hypothetical protein